VALACRRPGQIPARRHHRDTPLASCHLAEVPSQPPAYLRGIFCRPPPSSSTSG